MRWRRKRKAMGAKSNPPKTEMRTGEEEKEEGEEKQGDRKEERK